MILTWTLAGVLVLTTVMVHYEVLRLLDWAMQHLKPLHRLRVVVVVLGCFCAHIVEIVIFAVAFYFSAASLDLGSIQGAVGEGFRDYLYFSFTNYTSLGVGDIYATGDMRMLAGIEALIGLMMITWSATFAFLEMTKLWRDRARRD